MTNLGRRAFCTAVLAAGLVGAAPSHAQAPTEVFGRWRTIDDETGKPKAIVELRSEKGELRGTIVELIDPPVPNPVCVECKGDRKGKPVRGLEIVWGLHRESDGAWTGGYILDPKSGKDYRCKMQLESGGAKLKVRGYIGMALLGRTQVWERAR